MVGRNEPCPCGSGKKYKKCHGTYSHGHVESTVHAEPYDTKVSVGFTERNRSYNIDDLIKLKHRKPLQLGKLLPQSFGGASGIPEQCSNMGMFQRIYECPFGLWHIDEDPITLLYQEDQYQVELRRANVQIMVARQEWGLGPDKQRNDIVSYPVLLNPKGYYCCITCFIPSKEHDVIEKVGTIRTETIAGVLSLTLTPDLVRNPIWESTFIKQDPNDKGYIVRPNIIDYMFRVMPPTVVAESFEAVNAITSSCLSVPQESSTSLALRYYANAARTQFIQDRFIWLYLSIRVIVDRFYKQENQAKKLPAQEQVFNYYAARYFKGNSEIVNGFKKVYKKRNMLLKDYNPIVNTDEYIRVHDICDKLIKNEIDLILNHTT